MPVKESSLVNTGLRAMRIAAIFICAQVTWIVQAPHAAKHMGPPALCQLKPILENF
jgi:hypothetical protein